MVLTLECVLCFSVFIIQYSRTTKALESQNYFPEKGKKTRKTTQINKYILFFVNAYVNKGISTMYKGSSRSLLLSTQNH